MQKLKDAVLSSKHVLGGALAVIGSRAFAAPPDVAAVVSEINGSLTPIGLIGAAVLLVIVGIMVFKWIRRAM